MLTLGREVRILGQGVNDEDFQLGALVRAYRHESGLTQQELAAKAGLSVAALRDIEQSRRRRPRSSSLHALADALNLDHAQTARLASVGRDQTGQSPQAIVSPPGRGGSGAQGLWISVLGPLEAWRDGRPLPLGPPARRMVLGLLLLEPNRLVHRDAMIDLLWGDAPPRTALGLVQTHISRLRKAFVRPEATADRALPIDSLGGGYRLRLSSGELDLLAFRDLSERASAAQAAGDDNAAYRLYEQAVELWRGDPLADLEPMVGHPGIARLRQEQSSVLLRHADVACSVGQHQVAVKRLLMMTSTDPLNEPVHARLMIALAGLGQQAAAIAVYEGLRTRLDRELGLYPSEELADAHLRVLRQDVPTQRSLRPALELIGGRASELICAVPLGAVNGCFPEFPTVRSLNCCTSAVKHVW